MMAGCLAQIYHIRDEILLTSSALNYTSQLYRYADTLQR